MSASDPPEELRDHHWIETEEVSGPGADFGPGFLLIGLALCVLLLVALT